MFRRILYLQFTNPAAYPPLEHSSEIFAERGWQVLLLGTETFNDKRLTLPEHPRRKVKNLPLLAARWQQRLEYVYFLFWSLYWIYVWRPVWIYASDPLASPVALFIQRITRIRVLYHEHDSPNRNFVRSWLMRAIMACRDRLAKEADLCVLPQSERMHEFLKHTGRRRVSLCVWNCASRGEVKNGESKHDHRMIVYYHGSLNSARLPPQLVVAASRLKETISLRLIGYETAGSVGYVEWLKKFAGENGAPELIEWLGAMPRKDLMSIAATADIGVSLMPKLCDDVNMLHMVGASNKPFDCMACALPLLVSDLPDWVSTFVEPGYARACDPDDPDSIEAELRWYVEHPNERREMGRKCRQQVQTKWNYEAAFTEALAWIEKGNPQ